MAEHENAQEGLIGGSVLAEEFGDGGGQRVEGEVGGRYSLEREQRGDEKQCGRTKPSSLSCKP